MRRVRSTWQARLVAGLGLLQAAIALWFLVWCRGDVGDAEATLADACDALPNPVGALSIPPDARTGWDRVRSSAARLRATRDHGVELPRFHFEDGIYPELHDLVDPFEAPPRDFVRPR